jgi:hypothetical protein
MKNKLNSVNFIALLFITMFTFACKKGVDSSPNQVTAKSLYELLKEKNVKTDGNISLTASSMSFSDFPAAQIDITATFNDKNGKVVKADNVKVGTYDIQGTPNFYYSSHFNPYDNKNDFSSIASSLFGNTVKCTVNSKDFGNVTSEIYSPMTVKMDLGSIKDDKILKSTGLTIKWNSDNGRVQLRDGLEQYVGATVVYQAGLSDNSSQPGLPTQNVTVFKYSLDAAGQITFTPQELAALPNFGYVTIMVGRAEQQIVTTSNGQTLGITSLAMSSSQGLQVLE